MNHAQIFLRSYSHVGIFLSAFLLVLLLSGPEQASAQVIVRPSLGLQTLQFIGEPPAVDPINPGQDRALPLGGGLLGAHPGLRLQLEVMSSEKSILRLPISFEYFAMNGKTTFALSSRQTTRKRRLNFTHEASIATGGLGITASFFNVPSLYVTGELKGVYFLPTSLEARIYYADNDETIESRTLEPFSGAFRLGAGLRIGTQVAFFEPFLLDINGSVAGLNLLLKETDPAVQRDLMTVDNQRHDPETTLGEFGFNISILWKL